MKQKLLYSFRLKATLLVAVLCALFTGTAWGAEEVYKTALFGSDYNAKNSSYTSSFDATNGSFIVTATNFNNNNNGWTNSAGNGQIKCGRKNNASVGTITTKSAIDEAITKVVVTVDAFTSGKVNSFKLYVASDASFTQNLQTITATIATGANTFTVTTPTANRYYKVEIDCASGSGNGLVTVSKVEYYYNAGGSVIPTGPTVSFGTHTNVTLSMKDGDNNDLSSGAEVAEGTTVKVYASADAGYKVSSVSAVDADEAAVALTQETGYWSFTMPSKNVTINATAVAKTDPALAFSPATASGTIGQAFTAPTLTNTHNVSPISWSSDDAGVATVSNGVVTLVGEGTATITASFAGDDDYSASEASYTLTVTDPSAITLWSEDFSSFDADDVPSGGTYSYACTNGGGTTKIYNQTSTEGGQAPELLVGKSSGTFTAVVPLNNATGTLTLTYKTNAKSMTVSTTTDGITGDGSFNTKDTHTVTFTGVEGKSSITIVFTSGSDNVRLDDIVLRGQAQTASVEAPTFSINGGTYYTEQTVELSCATTGATIYYSTDDTNWTEYTQALTISSTTTLYAKAMKGSDESTHPSITITIAEKNDVEFNITDKTLAYGETYKVTYGNYSGRDVQSDGYVTVTSNNAVATVSSGTTITAAAVGTATITLNVAEGDTYKSGSTTFTVTVTAPTGQTTAPTATPLFYETFNSCDGTGGRDDVYSGNIGTKDTKDKLDETWTTIGSNGASQCIKLGTSGAVGTVTTSNIELTGNGTLTYSAAGWETGTNTVAITATGATISGDTEVTMDNGAWNNYTVNIEDAEGEVAITFTMKRGFLDDVKVIDNSAAAPTATVLLNTSGYGTFCSVNPMDFTTTVGYTAWRISSIDMDGTTGTVNCEKITEAIKGGQGVLLYNKNAGGVKTNVTVNFADGTTEFSDSENKLKGTTAPTFVEAEEVYGLSGNAFVRSNADGVIPAGKAYLEATSIPAGVKSFTFVFNDEATGITETRTATREEVEGIFNLAGQRMSKMQKGINIVNGKKVLVK